MIERAALLDSRMAGVSNVLGGIVLIAADVYQWTPLKDVCLAQCQTPFQFLMRHGGFRGDVPAVWCWGSAMGPIASAVAAGFSWRFCLLAAL
jgi:predicted metal-binding membrane protein